MRSVSCVSSIGRRRGTLSTNAAWSGVAAHAVMRNPAAAETPFTPRGFIVPFFLLKGFLGEETLEPKLRRRGMLRTNTAWSGMAAHAVMQNPYP